MRLVEFRGLLLCSMSVASALLFSRGAQADSMPQSLTMIQGTKSGTVQSLAASGEGRIVNLYSSRRGNLNAEMSFSKVGLGSNISVKGLFKQNSLGNRFSIQALGPKGEWLTLGNLPATKTFAAFNIPLSAQSGAQNGSAIRLRIVAGPNADDSALDAIALASTGLTPTPLPSTPPPTPKPSAVPSSMPSSTPVPTPIPSAVPSPKPSATPAPPPSSNSGIKLPPTGKIIWDWQIGASSESAIIAPAGARLMDIDGFNVSATKVAQLKAQGIYTVCYLDVGSWEQGRPDSNQYPESLKIHYDSAWGEWFLDVTDVFKPNSSLATILRNRFQMCKDKGFDAIEPDNLQNDENAGGKITLQQQIDFNGWIADLAHDIGIAILQKNGPDKVLLKDRTGKMMVEKFDGILNEECQQYNECAPLSEYPKRGKLALNVEYKKGLTVDCATSDRLQMNSIKKDLNLTGATANAYVLQSCP